MASGKPKKPKKTSPTQRSLEYLRDWGYLPGVVEKWIPQTKRRKDLFGILDIVAVRASDGTTAGVQCTTESNIHSRIQKILESPSLPILLAAKWMVVVHGWSKVNGRWKCSVTDVGKLPATMLPPVSPSVSVPPPPKTRRS